MSGVLHPIGPEPERVYWVRRLLVMAAAVILVVLLIAIVTSLGTAARAGGPEAIPAPVESTSAPAEGTTGASPSSTVRDVPSSSTASSGAAQRSTGSKAGEPSRGSSSGSSGSSGKAESPKPSAGASSSASSSPSAPAAVAVCTPAQLRQTLTGPKDIRAKAKTEFSLSLINGSGQSCQVKLDSSRFLLTVYSGSDRIWSTADCPSQIKPATVKVADEDAYEWKQTWNGLRSVRHCKAGPEVPRPGTYWATASYTGIQPVRFRMILR